MGSDLREKCEPLIQESGKEQILGFQGGASPGGVIALVGVCVCDGCLYPPTS